MPRLFLFTVLFVALGIVGCRESVVGPDPLTPTTPTPSPVSYRAIYLKGPSTLSPRDLGEFRAEPMSPDLVARYRWGYTGEGDIETTSDDPEGRMRIVAARATAPGGVSLYVHALDAEGQIVGIGTKVVVIE